MALLMTTVSVFALSLTSYNSATYTKAVSACRSGNIDIDAEEETYYNSFAFAPVSGVTSYDIIRDGEVAAVVKAEKDGSYAAYTANEAGEFVVNAGEVKMENGEIVYTDVVVDVAVNPGEANYYNEVDEVYYYYTVGFEANGETYVSDGVDMTYYGRLVELGAGLTERSVTNQNNVMSVALAWYPHGNVEAENVSFEVYRNDGNGWEMILSTDELEYVDRYINDENGNVYYYAKMITEMGEFSTPIVGASYTVAANGVVTAIDAVEEDAAIAVSVYPNPSTDYITVEGAQSEISLYSLNGAQVMSMPVAEGETVTMDVTGLVKGMYILKAEGAEAVKVLVK